jgi:hypothetical protein
MQRAPYVHLYTDAQGESHFEDLETELVEINFAPPAAPLLIGHFLPTARSLWMCMPVGWAGEIFHPAPQRQIFCILQGEVELTASDGSVRRLTPGSVLLMEDNVGKGHSTHVVGDQEVLIFVTALATN